MIIYMIRIEFTYFITQSVYTVQADSVGDLPPLKASQLHPKRGEKGYLGSYKNLENHRKTIEKP